MTGVTGKSAESQLLNMVGLTGAYIARTGNPTAADESALRNNFMLDVLVDGGGNSDGFSLWNTLVALHIAHGPGNYSATTSFWNGTAGGSFKDAAMMGYLALKTPKHGGASGEAARLMGEMMSMDESKWTGFLQEWQELLFGFGHAVLTEDDVRAIMLLSSLSSYKPDLHSKIANIIEAIRTHLKEKKDLALPINVDSVSWLAYQAIGLNNVETASFFMSRLLGLYLAYKQGTVSEFIRPAGFYNGSVPA